METWLSAVLGGVGVAIIGIVLKLVEGWLSRRKTKAEAKSTEADIPGKIVDAAGDLATQAMTMVKAQQEQVASLQKDIEGMAALKESNKALQKEVDQLKQDFRTLHAEMAEWKRGARILVNQLKEVGIHPRWEPPKREEREYNIARDGGE